MTSYRFVRVVEYWNTHESISRHEWVMFIVREELSRFGEGMREQSKGGGKGLSGGRTKELNHKVFAHMKESRFSGKDGGVGWGSFFEDVLVALGSTDRDLEEAVKEVIDLRGSGKELTTREKVEDYLDPNVRR